MHNGLFCIDRFVGIGIKFEDEIQGLWLLGTLPDTWETFRTTLSNYAPDGVITVELAKGSILNEEMRRKKKVNTTTDEFFVCYDYDMVNLANDDSSLILDSGATCHVATRKDYYSFYTPGDFGVVRIGLHDEDGYHNSSGNGLWKVTLGSLIVARGKRNPRKQTRLAFKSRSPFRMENILDLVHFDVCGPMKTKTLRGCSYFVTFIDDHSRKVWVFTLKTKDQVLDVFKQFHALVKRQTGKKLKCIQTNNGGEYIGPFDAYCREHGIQHQQTPPKTPQLNGLSERMNRTLVERVRCLLSHAGVPASFWASVHIPKDERSKLDVKGKPCVFLGYGQDEFGYKLYDPVQKKLVLSRDVVFEEDLTLKDVKKAERETIPQHNDDLIDLDLVPPKHFDSQFGDDIQNGEEHDEEHDDRSSSFHTLRRSTRDHHSAHEYVLLTNGGEPECYAEAMEDEHKKEWFEAMEDEMNSLHENNTFELARLVVKGFSQKRGIDFDEIFSPVVKMGSIRVVLGLAASLDLEVEQIDVKTAFLHGDLDKEIYMEQPEGFQVKGKEGYVSFLHGDLDKEIYMEQPEGFQVKGKEGYVCRLQKSVYGLKQAPRQWFNMDKAKVVSSPLTTNFKLTDKDCPSSKKIIEKMDRVPYASAIGSLMYVMVCTRPDLAHAVGVVSRFLSNPGKKHREAVKWIFRYLRGTSKLGIAFGNEKPMLVGFTDSYMAGNKDNMKSTSRYLMTFAGGTVSWQSRLQKCVALSTTEAEYMAATEACKELLWLKRFLQELGFKQQRYAVLCDNKRAIHLDIRYHLIKNVIEDGMFELNKVHT
ncbi:retrovirus-related pol polyprotein from transposon TNT 1-94, partial [Tanacetum coccineum]